MPQNGASPLLIDELFRFTSINALMWNRRENKKL